MSQKLEQVKKELGEPAYEKPGILIYNEDCLEGMRKLAGAHFDLVVTSPPYNIGKEYESIVPVEDYVDWCRFWIQQVQRMLQPNGQFWLNVGHLPVPGRARWLPISYLLWDQVPMHFQQEIVWVFDGGQVSKRGFAARNEKFLWYVQDPDNYVFNLDAVRDPNVINRNDRRNNPIGKNPTDVWLFSTLRGNSHERAKHPHPAQFPTAMIERIIKACSNPGDVILDPFMGSGTVAEVAAQNGRLVVGFEIDAKYVEVIKKRIEGMSLASLSAFEV